MIGINQMLIMRLVSFLSLRCLSFCVLPGLCYLRRRPSKIEGGGWGGWRGGRVAVVGERFVALPPSHHHPSRSLARPPASPGIYHPRVVSLLFLGARFLSNYLLFNLYNQPKTLRSFFPPSKPQQQLQSPPLSLFLPQPLLWGPGHAGTYTLTRAPHPSNARSHVLRTLCYYIYNRSYSVRVWWDIPRA